jgi:hypothetical protein
VTPELTEPSDATTDPTAGGAFAHVTLFSDQFASAVVRRSPPVDAPSELDDPTVNASVALVTLQPPVATLNRSSACCTGLLSVTNRDALPKFAPDEP